MTGSEPTPDKLSPLAEAEQEATHARTGWAELQRKAEELRGFAETASKVARHSSEPAEQGRAIAYQDMANKLARIL